MGAALLFAAGGPQGCTPALFAAGVLRPFFALLRAAGRLPAKNPAGQTANFTITLPPHSLAPAIQPAGLCGGFFCLRPHGHRGTFTNAAGVPTRQARQNRVQTAACCRCGIAYRQGVLHPCTEVSYRVGRPAVPGGYQPRANGSGCFACSCGFLVQNV